MLDITQIDFDDQEVWNMIGEGKTKGCFQIESHLGKTWSQKLKPQNIEELAALISIIRPGCISGDTYVTIKKYIHTDKKYRFVRKKIRDLCLDKNKPKEIFSIDEDVDSLNILSNKVIDIFYSGQKECFRVNIRKYSMAGSCKNNHPQWYNLECTDDHKLLRSDMKWVSLKDLKNGDRIAAYKKKNNRDIRSDTICNRHHPKAPRQKNVSGTRYFAEICYKHYCEKCVMCGWDEATIDVHHLEGNRHTDNSPENLAFLCPNCHRKQTKGLISIKDIIEGRNNLVLPKSDDIEWVTYINKTSVGIKDTYDISMKGPNHNFIAGNFIVHNCLKAYDKKGKTMTQKFVDCKFGVEEIESIYEPIDDILKETYGIIVYQEQAMRIAQVMAGFNESEADDLRKAIGKKLADLMKEVREKFLKGCEKNNVSLEKAEEVFDIIEKSARYSFNKSHGVGYAFVAYWCAYLKCHYPKEFFKHWLRNSDDKMDTDFERKQLIMAAKAENINIKGPTVKYLKDNFFWADDSIYFGIVNVKNVGQAHLDKLVSYKEDLHKEWTHIIFHVLPNINKRAIENLIKVGAFAGNKKSRTEMLHEFSCVSDLTKKELQTICEKFSLEGKSVLDVITELAMMGTKSEGGFVSSSRRMDKINNIVSRLKNPGRSLDDNPASYAKIEEKLLGCSINHSELTGCAKTCHADTTCKEIIDGKKGKSIVAGIIKKVKEHKTKNQDIMAFLAIEDDECELDNIVVFPSVYETHKDILYIDATVLISGEVKPKEKSFIVEEVFLI